MSSYNEILSTETQGFLRQIIFLKSFNSVFNVIQPFIFSRLCFHCPKKEEEQISFLWRYFKALLMLKRTYNLFYIGFEAFLPVEATQIMNL